MCHTAVLRIHNVAQNYACALQISIGPAKTIAKLHTYTA